MVLELLVHHTVRTAEAVEMSARRIANVAYEAARSGRAELLGLLFSTLARLAEQRMGEFNKQDLANTAWAFATVNRPDEKLFTALARAAEQRMR